MRKAGERVRITAQLIDAVTGAHLWAERYDRTLKDIFAVQDEVVATITATLAGRIETGRHRAGKAQADRGTCSPMTACCAAWSTSAATARTRTQQARAMFERAAELDPGYALARAYLALTIYVEWTVERSAAPGPGNKR